MFEVPKAIGEYWPDDAWARESWQARDQSFGDMSVYTYCLEAEAAALVPGSGLSVTSAKREATK